MNKTESVTPYAASKLANAYLLEKGIDKTLPPQMFYNYTTSRIRKGKAPLIETVQVEDQYQITVKGLAEWLEKYTTKSSNVEIEAADQSL